MPWLARTSLPATAVTKCASLRSADGYSWVVLATECTLEVCVLDESEQLETVSSLPVFGIVHDVAVLRWDAGPTATEFFEKLSPTALSEDLLVVSTDASVLCVLTVSNDGALSLVREVPLTDDVGGGDGMLIKNALIAYDPDSSALAVCALTEAVGVILAGADGLTTVSVNFQGCSILSLALLRPHVLNPTKLPLVALVSRAGDANVQLCVIEVDRQLRTAALRSRVVAPPSHFPHKVVALPHMPQHCLIVADNAVWLVNVAHLPFPAPGPPPRLSPLKSATYPRLPPGSRPDIVSFVNAAVDDTSDIAQPIVYLGLSSGDVISLEVDGTSTFDLTWIARVPPFDRLLALGSYRLFLPCCTADARLLVLDPSLAEPPRASICRPNRSPILDARPMPAPDAGGDDALLVACGMQGGGSVDVIRTGLVWNALTSSGGDGSGSGGFQGATRVWALRSVGAAHHSLLLFSFVTGTRLLRLDPSGELADISDAAGIDQRAPTLYCCVCGSLDGADVVAQVTPRAVVCRGRTVWTPPNADGGAGSEEITAAAAAGGLLFVAYGRSAAAAAIAALPLSGLCDDSAVAIAVAHIAVPAAVALMTTVSLSAGSDADEEKCALVVGTFAPSLLVFDVRGVGAGAAPVADIDLQHVEAGKVAVPHSCDVVVEMSGGATGTNAELSLAVGLRNGVVAFFPIQGEAIAMTARHTYAVGRSPVRVASCISSERAHVLAMSDDACHVLRCTRSLGVIALPVQTQDARVIDAARFSLDFSPDAFCVVTSDARMSIVTLDPRGGLMSSRRLAAFNATVWRVLPLRHSLPHCAVAVLRRPEKACELVFIDTRTGHVRGTFSRLDGGAANFMDDMVVHALAELPDGRLAVGGSHRGGSGFVILLDVRANDDEIAVTQLSAARTGARVPALCVVRAADGGALLVAGHGNVLAVLNESDGAIVELCRASVQFRVRAVYCSPNGDIIVADARSSITVYRMRQQDDGVVSLAVAATDPHFRLGVSITAVYDDGDGGAQVAMSDLFGNVMCIDASAASAAGESAGHPAVARTTAYFCVGAPALRVASLRGRSWSALVALTTLGSAVTLTPVGEEAYALLRAVDALAPQTSAFGTDRAAFRRGHAEAASGVIDGDALAGMTREQIADVVEAFNALPREEDEEQEGAAAWAGRWRKRQADRGEADTLTADFVTVLIDYFCHFVYSR